MLYVHVLESICLNTILVSLLFFNVPQKNATVLTAANGKVEVL
jgi:hypothetical protein